MYKYGSCSGRLFYAGYSKIVAGNLGFDQWVNDSGCVRIHGGKIFDETRIRIVDGSGWMDGFVRGWTSIVSVEIHPAFFP